MTRYLAENILIIKNTVSYLTISVGMAYHIKNLDRNQIAIIRKRPLKMTEVICLAIFYDTMIGFLSS